VFFLPLFFLRTLKRDDDDVVDEIERVGSGVFSFVVVGCWLLVVGCWLLVVGCWLLVVGCWLLLLLSV